MAIFTLTTAANVFFGTAANDSFNATLGTFGEDDFLVGGGGTDTLFLGGTASGLLVLEDRIDSIESVSITGIAAISLDTSSVLHALLLTGNSAANAITGTGLGDALNGGGGNDTLVGAGGDDTINGGALVDSIFGETGNDLILVGAATEVTTAEVINGGDGNDVLRITAASGLVTLGAGVTQVERIQIASATGAMNTSTAGVVASAVGYGLEIVGSNGVNAITGTAHADTLIGNGGNDILNGGDGDDTFAGGAGNDNLQGGAGSDIFRSGPVAEFGLDTVNGGDSYDALFFNSTTPGDTLVLAGTRITNLEEVRIGDALGDMGGTTPLNVDASAVSGFLSLYGNEGANSIVGTMGGDGILGNGGNDLLFGLSGFDSIDGGAGADTISGGAGDDTLVGGAGADVIRGGMGDDRIRLQPDHFAQGEVIDGGSGTDTLAVEAMGGTLDLIAAPHAAIRNIEFIDLGFGTGNTLRLDSNDVFSLSPFPSGVLWVNGFAGQFVESLGAWEASEQVPDYTTYTLAGATLHVDADIAFSSNVNVNLAALNGTNGFRLNGLAAGDRAGIAVSDAGDVNGDGYADFIVGADEADPHGETSGTSYVVFGGQGGFGASFNLSTLNGTNGFRILGETEFDRAGRSVSAAGDVNGDGFGDLLVGAFNADGVGTYGAAYLVFGKAGGFAANLELSALDGISGVQISGAQSLDRVGRSVSAAGDFNGDGYGDFIIGNDGSVENGTYSGAAYVVFGRAESFGANLSVSALGGDNGFRLLGETGYDRAGWSVSGTGDVNGDGFDDVVIGAYSAPNPLQIGASYVVFGGAGPFTASFQLSALTGSNGFRISGQSVYDQSGFSVSGAGDVNGDGVGDVIIGAKGSQAAGANTGGASYVVFGSTGGFAANVNLSGLDGSTGLKIAGASPFEHSGISVSAAGDINGDGFGDLLIGAHGAPGGIYNGAAYVLFGGTADYLDTLHGTTGFSLSGINGSNGFRVIGAANFDEAGSSVSAAGDVNGDGYDDLLVGAPKADPNGNYSGASYVFYGKDFRGEADLQGTAGDDALTGTDAGNEILVGGLGNDTLRGGGGFGDVLKGGAGDDVLHYGFSTPRVEGGSGSDTLSVVGQMMPLLDLTAAAESKVSGIEVIDLTGENVNVSVTLDVAGLVAMTEGAHILRIDGNAGDSVSAGSDWFYAGNIQSGGQTYAQYTQGPAVLQVNTEVARDIDFEISLASLSGANGFQISGEEFYDRSGNSVSGTGDVNGDGFEDVIVGAHDADPNGPYSGASYVVFGSAGGFGPNLDLSTLNGSNGFQISGEVVGDTFGRSVSGAGDVNGDGLADLIVGAVFADPNDPLSGASYVVFGRAGGFAPTVELPGLDGTDGFQISGEAGGDRSGQSVSGAGDVNGDGFADLIVGAYYADANGSDSGASYVVFGRAGGFAPTIELLGLNGSNGFQISGEGVGDRSGFSVSGAGDVNGDGFDDLVLGAHYANSGSLDSGASYVVFGKASGFAANLDLFALDGANGFEITIPVSAQRLGYSVSSAGDVNGDGFDDIILGAPIFAASYVVFGKAAGFAASLSVSSLNGTNGFRVSGENGSDFLGASVSSAGDVNGDGFADLVVGAPSAGGVDLGATYVVFGKASGFGADLNVATLDGTSGFQISGEFADDRAGGSVSSAGDVNGDGFDDLIIGALQADPNGNNLAGASYVLFGQDYRGDVDLAGTAGDDLLSGNDGDNILIGGLGDDTLSGFAGVDVMKGGAGDDRLIFDAADFRVDGGSGEDTLVFGGAGTFALAGHYAGIEAVDLTGSGNNTLLLQTRDVLDVSDTTHTLRIDGNAGDRVVSMGQGWLLGGTQAIDGVLYQAYTDGAAMLLIDTAVTQQIS